jgi:transcriptional regulator with XRE-family HTH domain
MAQVRRASGPRFSVTLNAAALSSVFERVYSRRGSRALTQILHAFGLKKAELGRLFGVSRQSIDEWLRAGVPHGRIADVSRVADLADTLAKRFKRERLPQIVRAPLPGLNEQSILQAIQRHGVVPVFEMLERAFSYIPAA